MSTYPAGRTGSLSANSSGGTRRAGQGTAAANARSRGVASGNNRDRNGTTRTVNARATTGVGKPAAGGRMRQPLTSTRGRLLTTKDKINNLEKKVSILNEELVEKEKEIETKAQEFNVEKEKWEGELKEKEEEKENLKSSTEDIIKCLREENQNWEEQFKMREAEKKKKEHVFTSLVKEKKKLESKLEETNKEVENLQKNHAMMKNVVASMQQLQKKEQQKSADEKAKIKESMRKTCSELMRDFELKKTTLGSEIEVKAKELAEREEELNEARDHISQIESEKEDLHSSIEDFKNHVAELGARIEEVTIERDSIEQECEKLQRKISKLESDLESAEEEIKEKDAELRKKGLEVNNLNESIYEEQRSVKRYRDQIEDMEEENRKKARIINEREEKVSNLDIAIGEMKEKHRDHYEIQRHMQMEIESSGQENLRARKEIAQLTIELETARRSISNMMERIEHGEKFRRQLHNQIQELKGNIRVYCRVRPLLSEEIEGSAGSEHITFPTTTDSQSIRLMSTAIGVVSQQRDKVKEWNFDFDRVFPPETSQETMFEEIAQLVQSALDGYKVCIFAYGQTGSGKTFTMEGGDDEELRGMIPRSVEAIFKTTAALEEKGWNYALDTSFVEIYNDKVKDLLTKSSRKTYEIKHEGSETVVTGAKVIRVKQPREVYKVLKTAAETRSVASTKCNERSSRSHSVFIMKLTGKNENTGEIVRGTLNLVDLAGSERLKESGATGDRLKETQAINKSLSCIGDVISALANKEKHIPFRNSKLTYLLQNSLGGDSKTLMIVNVSPTLPSFQESLCSLRFASKVNACHIGTATRNMQVE